uniref:Uncharacterized protein n=2 Tax=Onchocerca TaxID=6281 RepID=A0A8R1XNY5_ONCVO
MRLLLCCIILIIINRNTMLCYICHVYSQDLNKLRKERDPVPKSVLLVRKFSQIFRHCQLLSIMFEYLNSQTTNCSFCFGIIRLNMFITGCRRHGSAESKTLNEFYGLFFYIVKSVYHFLIISFSLSTMSELIYLGVMCSRNPTYCGSNFCCCASTSCYDQLRNHFLQGLLQPKKDIICDVYRQQWIGNRPKTLNISFYPTSEQLYRRISCDACASRVDEKGVEMTCIEKDIEIACHGMNVFVGDDITCSANGDCCCQREDCSKALRIHYSNHQKMFGTARMFAASNSGYYLNPSSLIIAISIFIIVF